MLVEGPKEAVLRSIHNILNLCYKSTMLTSLMTLNIHRLIDGGLAVFGL
jgi:hypothetical protein